MNEIRSAAEHFVAQRIDALQQVVAIDGRLSHRQDRRGDQRYRRHGDDVGDVPEHLVAECLDPRETLVLGEVQRAGIGGEPCAQ